MTQGSLYLEDDACVEAAGVNFISEYGTVIDAPGNVLVGEAVVIDLPWHAPAQDNFHDQVTSMHYVINIWDSGEGMIDDHNRDWKPEGGMIDGQEWNGEAGCER